MGESSVSPQSVVELNIGGVFYTTSSSTLTWTTGSRLSRMFSPTITTPSADIPHERGIVRKVTHNGKVFIDRDGVLFRYVLDYLRNKELVLPETFKEHERLRCEAEFYELPDLINRIDESTMGLKFNRRFLSDDVKCIAQGRAEGAGGGFDGQKESGCITVGYRGTFAFGRDGTGTSDVKFRKMLRILVAGRVFLCKEVFQDTLNESRDPDRGNNDRYTARFFLKHVFLEQAFDMLHDARFRLVGSSGSGTNSAPGGDSKGSGKDSEENKWLHYNEYVFIRP